MNSQQNQAVTQEPAKYRRIARVISPATATHCGTDRDWQSRCQFLGYDHGHWFCRCMGSGFSVGATNGLAVPERLPDCIASEVQ